MKHEEHNLHGTGSREHEVYEMAVASGGDPWASVTDVPCPVKECKQTVVWYEAGYVPGYRVCMRAIGDGHFDHETLRHRFQAREVGSAPKLVRHDCCE